MSAKCWEELAGDGRIERRCKRPAHNCRTKFFFTCCAGCGAGRPTTSSPHRPGVAASLLQEAPIPVYPPLAKVAGVQGTVKMQIQIGSDGHVEQIKILSGHPLLAPAAVEAVKGYVYKPFVVNGTPVEVMTTVAVEFSIPDK
jgi:TonB family protein